MNRSAINTVSCLTSASLLSMCAAGVWAQSESNDVIIQPSRMMADIKELSSDAYEGRAPGTPGEAKTIAYLQKQFKKAGLKPGNPDGTYLQKVPMVGLTPHPTVSFGGCAAGLKLEAPTDFVAFSTQVKPAIDTRDASLVFVGYGVVAPEYGWDDYKGLDVKGKTLVMLINDPQVPDAHDPTKLDTSLFKGDAMTYYGRWSYKFEIAAAKGAVGAIIIHETKPAAYPWFVVMNSNMRENVTLDSKGGNAEQLPVRSWIRLDHGKAMLSACGQDYDSLKAAASRPDFRPVALDGSASFHLEQAVRHMTSYNVVGKLDGADKHLRRDWLVYSAHWDHLGRNLMMKDKPIYHGAQDNATGTSGLLELARVWGEQARQGKRAARSVLFMATTAEEAGLLGARYYTSHPLYPLARTVADLNMDGMNPLGKTRDVEALGSGHSSMDDYLDAAVKARRRVWLPDSVPELGLFYRADQFEFAKVGIPTLYLKSGNEYIGQAADYGRKAKEAYTANDYHKPTDVIKPDWTMAGGADDLGLLYDVGLRLANSGEWPLYRVDSEFNAAQKVWIKARQ
ncbi:M28 family peptidase [Burkholderiaceae bacterium DAT-1]|nr:M28 family peptidase [Burkholderiaceae bacterium DAT-1]